MMHSSVHDSEQSDNQTNITLCIIFILGLRPSDKYEMIDQGVSFNFLTFTAT